MILSGLLGGEYDDEYDDQYDTVEGIGAGGDDFAGTYDAIPTDSSEHKFNDDNKNDDLENIKTYNRLMKESVEEQAYWKNNENRNYKKMQQETEDNQKSTENSQVERKYRGPDKGKGGRMIGPDGRYLPIKKGGKKKQNSNQSDKDEDTSVNIQNDKDANSGKNDGKNLTKIQKRRKNDNKAKIGNHHRKERALKKASHV
eukprot:CAMPEP_0184857554 /NCGR_PEP_ID=MMETSP0580-20130426/2707_1 /TAXON_ID=1118495 /ORGANISM="Dactyliosolen fragilissimus" /LENGTH=199 /DNA_ID=CAMNT_0027353213 /DNA_START=1 /DNA_END=600 /DNA_ORIENTATION=-